MSPVVPSAQAMLLRGVALAALTLCGACGSSEGDGPVDAGGEGWPLQVDTPGVLGYAALRASPVQVGDLLDDGLGWRPAGLSADEPLLLLMLDHTVLGGDMAFGLPVDDPQAFEQSLVASPAVDVLGGGRFHINLGADHPLVVMQRAAAGMGSSGPSPTDVLEAMSSSKQFVLSMQLRWEGDWALLSPSFEAGLVAADCLGELPGLLRDGDDSLVLSLDAERIENTYHDQIQGARSQLRSMLLGAQLGGLASAMMAARGGGETGPDLPVSGEFLWTVLDMLDLERVRAVQLAVRDVDVFAAFQDPEGVLGRLFDEDDDGAATPRRPGAADLRLALDPGAPLHALVQSLRPAPQLPGARLSLAADPATFAGAIAGWLRPVVEFAYGEGAPAERELAELRELVAPWAGLATLVEDRAGELSLALATGGRFDGEGLGAWLDAIADAAAWEGERPWSSDSGSSDSGSPAARYGWLDYGDVLIYGDTTGAANHEDVAANVREGLDGWAAPDGLALVFRARDDAAPQGLRADEAGLVLELRWGEPAVDAPPR